MSQKQPTDEELEAPYGRVAPYSEHKRGDTITYEQSGVECSQTILWVCGPGEVVKGGQQHPLRYIIENVHDGWPDTVYPKEVKVS